MRPRINFRESLTIPAVILCLVFATISCGGGGSRSSTPSSTPTPTPAAVSVTVSPTSASLSPSSTQQFNATVTGSSNTAVSWTVALQPGASGDPGTISPTGLYTAPGTVLGNNAVVATATAQADSTKSANASIGVIDNHEKETPPICSEPVEAIQPTVPKMQTKSHAVPEHWALWSLAVEVNSSLATTTYSIARGKEQ